VTSRGRPPRLDGAVVLTDGAETVLILDLPSFAAGKRPRATP
jgi:hypothetical protein